MRSKEGIMKFQIGDIVRIKEFDPDMPCVIIGIMPWVGVKRYRLRTVFVNTSKILSDYDLYIMTWFDHELELVTPQEP